MSSPSRAFPTPLIVLFAFLLLALGCGKSDEGAPPTPDPATCDDGTCDADESCSACADDCGTCTATCGDGTCDANEDCTACADDCGSCTATCGNGTCDADEDCTACADDCGSCTATCGDGTCDANEDCATCVADCGACTATCGDGWCGAGEDCESCASDCPRCVPACGDGVCDPEESCSGCASDCGACVTDGTFVDPLGSDTAGDGSIDNPWKTLRHAMTQLEPGQPLYLREGVHEACNVEMPESLSGTAASPTVLSGYPGEEAVLRCNRDFETMFDDPAAAWIPYDGPDVPDSVRGQIFISQASYSPKPLYGATLIFDNGGEDDFFLLGKYNRKEDLFSDWERAPSSPNADPRLHPTVYAGPGWFREEQDDGTWRIYIRLQPSDPSVLWPEKAPPGFTTQFTPTIDPRDYRILFTRNDNAMNFTASYAEIRNITFHGHRTAFGVRGSHLLFSGLTIKGHGISLGNGVSDVEIRSCTFDGGLPPWLTWVDIKWSNGPFYGWKTRPAGIAVAPETENITITDSAFVRAFDGVLPLSGGHGLRILNSYFNVKDDSVQLAKTAYDFEFAYNQVIGPAVSHQGNGAENPYPGRKWIHHNVIDSSRLNLWTRMEGDDDPDAVTNTIYEAGWIYHVPFPGHTSDSYRDPWKVYNNTVIYGATVWAHPLGLQLSGSEITDDEFSDPTFDYAGNVQEVYNNILVQVADQPYYKYYGPPSQVFDGNLYHRTFSGEFTTAAYRELGPGRWNSFDSLPELLLSEYFMTTQQYYAPGWEANGAEGDPLLGPGYAPATDSPAWTGGVDLRDTGWPGADGPYRGATPPP